MTTRRQFLKTSALGAGTIAFAPSFDSLLAATGSTEAPRRFIFIRKSNGVRPNEVALPSFNDK
ncbi:MAG: twin-arginine translocation signal domain-containing protein, partial [Planctomycetaceae bacterium]|nr:twin-arginine translocation signal domain-containing protein [Planctomycetaceae bacterium]